MSDDSNTFTTESNPGEQPSEEMDGNKSRHITDQPLSGEQVRCPGCETSQRWADFDAPSEDVDALATCSDCGTHILGFDTVTEDELEELTVFFDSLVDSRQSDERANEEVIS